jgi:hypothetical protein
VVGILHGVVPDYRLRATGSFFAKALIEKVSRGSGEPPGPGRNGERNFHKEKRSNETHASTTDPDARLYRKADGRESRLWFMGHVLMENRNGLAVAAALTRATATAEREAALALLDRRRSVVWIKAQAGLAKVKVRGCAKAEAVFTFAVFAYNLIRIPKLLASAA